MLPVDFRGQHRDPKRSTSPPWSILTLRSFDLQNDVVSTVARMDAEDSPWGGRKFPYNLLMRPNSADSSRRSFQRITTRSYKSSGRRRVWYTMANCQFGVYQLIKNTEAQKVKPVPSSISSTNPLPRSPAGRGPRTPRTPRRVELQPTRLESLDGGQGPLGPLGEEARVPETGPVPPLKEQNLPVRTNQPQRGAAIGGASRPDEYGDDASINSGRRPPPIQPPPSGIENRRQVQPSMSVEQAAKPSFSITVGDPHKVGDLTTSHIVYQVQTRVGVCYAFQSMTQLIIARPLQKHIKPPSSPFRAAIETSSGYLQVCTTIIPAL